ncbi:uncharacterized protein LOC124924492 [Impatiens glandulifera]|uniref:uncharacterized protein LOC124924492 n=1 Tax=Impatiens glandulifera TaxID=253017 RepID=UPI001FB11C6D|nr:uncharacterized protein LOC124924492 [Impatiens glandulifera]
MSFINKPLMFYIEEYVDWKIRMEVHLASQYDDMWFFITNGTIKIEKERCEWTAEYKRKNNLDNLAKNTLYKTLDKNMFAKIKACSTAKEIWEKIIQLCEGNKQTRENKLMVATQKFNSIKMHLGESMNEFDERFTNIFIEFSTLGKVYINKEIIIKALKTLPSAWDIKIMVMRESRNLHKMEFHDMFADLKAHEFEMNSRNEDKPSSSTVTQALVSSMELIVPSPIKSAEQFSKDAMTLLVKKLGKFMRKNQSNPSFNNNNNSNDHKANVRCFNYDTLGHYKSECRKPRRDDKNQVDQNNKKDQKAMLVEESRNKWAQSDSDSSSSSDSDD